MEYNPARILISAYGKVQEKYKNIIDKLKSTLNMSQLEKTIEEPVNASPDKMDMKHQMLISRWLLNDCASLRGVRARQEFEVNMNDLPRY